MNTTDTTSMNHGKTDTDNLEYVSAKECRLLKGTLHYEEKENRILFADGDGGKKILFPGTLLTVSVNGNPYPACLDLAQSGSGSLEYTLAGLNLWNEEMNGLTAYMPLYLHAYPGHENISESASLSGNHHGNFYRFSHMTVDTAARLDLAQTILRYIPSDIFAQITAAHFQYLLQGVKVDRTLWSLIKEVNSDCDLLHKRFTQNEIDSVTYKTQVTEYLDKIQDYLIAQNPSRFSPGAGQKKTGEDVADETKPKGIRYYMDKE